MRKRTVHKKKINGRSVTPACGTKAPMALISGASFTVVLDGKTGKYPSVKYAWFAVHLLTCGSTAASISCAERGCVSMGWFWGLTAVGSFLLTLHVVSEES